MKSPIIIVGAPRSGTSMMMSTMRHLLGYAGHNEAHFFTLLDQLLQTSASHYRPLSDAFNDKSNILLFDPVLTIDQDLKALFKNYLTKLYGDKPWFLKTPNSNAIKALPLILELYPEASLIFMKRRGIENVLSQSRKFGNGNFSADYCLEWSNCMTSFLSGGFIEKALIIDQLAYLKYPDLLIDKLLEYLKIERSSRLKARIKKYMMTNPVENTAKLTTDYIPLEETPWSDEEKSTFLDLCTTAMNMAAYPITRSEVSAFHPDIPFFFSGNQTQSIKANNLQTPWNRIPSDLTKPFKLHPNAVVDDYLTIFLSPPAGTLGLTFEMDNPKLIGKGVTVCLEALNHDEELVQKIGEKNLQCLERVQFSLAGIDTSSIIKIQVKNEKGSQNYNHKSLTMKVL